MIQIKPNIVMITKQSQDELLSIYSLKNGKIVLRLICIDSDSCFRIIINKFKNKFNQRLDLGLEYFVMDYHNMIKIINKVIYDQIMKITL